MEYPLRKCFKLKSSFEIVSEQVFERNHPKTPFLTEAFIEYH